MLAEIRDLQSSDVISVPAEGRTFGRMGMNKADLEVPHNAVSSVHARIFADGGHWYLEDLNSSNGTYVGNNRIEGRVRLEQGLRFSLSRYRFEVVRLGDLGDEDPTGAWDGYPESGGGDALGSGWGDDEGTGGNPQLIEHVRRERDARARAASVDFAGEPQTFLDPGGEFGTSEPFAMRWLGGIAMVVSVTLTTVLGLYLFRQNDAAAELDAAKATGDAAWAAAQAPAPAPAGEPVVQGGDEPEERLDEATEVESPSAPEAPAPQGVQDPVVAYKAKLADIEQAFKQNKKLAKKKDLSKLYKQIKKKNKKIQKKLRKKDPQKCDEAMLTQTGKLVDKLHEKLF